ncbi:hypothetical protein BCR35DRAFT_330888 [Leucosporidium creatinivorum]|uniref:Uncharacterized protein n=1 Tax=Leucosporidium creatinivorum TaxID=106004 RepID=A0A1Y2FN50_9BASI|nr:hypothetical protein BCR35DRAFT_330888 [Leucosporidium creatinivorum]
MTLGDPSPPTPPEYVVLTVRTDLTPSFDENGSLPQPQDYSDEEEQGDGPLTPLLPAYEDHEEQVKPLPQPPASCHPLRLSLLLLLAASLVAGWTAFDRYAPRGPSSPSEDATTVPNDTLQQDSSTLSSFDVASAPTTDVLRFLTAAGKTNDGAVPFQPRIYSALFPSSRPLDPTLASKAFPSSACAEQWIARGQLCAGMKGRWTGREEELKLDVSWTWVNGSSAERMAQWRESVSEEHGELRYSIRSVQQSFSNALRTLHLIVNDYPSFSPPSSSDLYSTPYSPTSLLAQVPHWLVLPSVDFSEPGVPPRSSKPALMLHPLSQIFKRRGSSPVDPGFDAEEQEAEQWRASVLPSFNSLSVESQLANLDHVGDTLLCLNDDFFLMQELSPSDISSPLTGPVFRFQRDLPVSSVSPDATHDDPDGEWRGLGYSNWLLSQRFGERARPYLVHEGKSVSMPMLREVQRVWVDELTETAASRFRGKAPLEVQLWFLLFHYTIEKHREALLWSFLGLHSDTNQDGVFSPAERLELLNHLGVQSTNTFSPSTDLPTSLHASTPRRTSLADSLSSTSYDDTGLQQPKQTSFAFSSMDGYALFDTDSDRAISRIGAWPTFAPAEDDEPTSAEESASPCEIVLDECFGDSFMSMSGDVEVSSVMKRVAFERPRCGDCLIVQLVAKSGEKGLEAFLPVEEQNIEGAHAGSEEVEAIGLAKDWQTAEFGASKAPSGRSRRQQAIALITRYAYVVGESSSRFLSMKAPASTSRMLDSLTSDRPAFVALNDDITYDVAGVDQTLEEWFQKTWPEPTKWELGEGTTS